METKLYNKEEIMRILDTTPKQVNGCDVYESEEGKISIKAEKDKLTIIFEPASFKKEFIDYINSLESSIWINSVNLYATKYGNLNLDNLTKKDVINFKKCVSEIANKIRTKFSDKINDKMKELDLMSKEYEKLEKYV